MSGTTEAEGVGSYSATVTPETGYAWADGTTGPVTVTWSIDPAPTAVGLTVTSGLTHDGTVKLGVVGGSDVTIGGTTSATAAGTYTATATPIANHAWSDGSTGTRSYTWSIARARTAIEPTLTARFIYDGVRKVGVRGGSHVTITGVTSATEVGAYTATATPTANYAWADGSTGARRYAWVIAATRINTSALEAAIAAATADDAATAVADSANEVASDTWWATPAAHDTLAAAVAAARNVLGSATTQAELDDATRVLGAARAAFAAARHRGAVTPVLRGTSHVSDIGWLQETGDADEWPDLAGGGVILGTTSKAKSLEALRLELVGTAGYQGWLEVCPHVRNQGWDARSTVAMPGVPTGNVGTTGKARSIEAICIALKGELNRHYRVEYRAHLRNVGWTGWVADGQIAGTIGQARPVEAVEVRFVARNA